ncbi:MAG: asparagine synthase (glutamine-hydrolyzing) [Candidatus Omnitrophota bacterium]
MCGIAGFFNYKTQRQVNGNALVDVLTSMRYRGPDNLGIFKDNDTTIGNVRLSIQDTTKFGNQPIYNEDRTLVVVYNGEIYNFIEIKTLLEKKGHIFSTKTDTEVLVHAYEEFGVDFIKDLNGMFSFALFDIKKRLLILTRDRSGQKPLFINNNNDGIFFSSEIKSMLPYLAQRSLNFSSLLGFLSMGYVLEPDTIIKEIEAVEPGTYLLFDYRGNNTKRFWSIQVNQSEIIYNIEDWKRKADVAIRNSVKRHLVSDVPITLFLSGGVDSSILALYLKEQGSIKEAFSGSFIGHKDHDEYGFASRLGKYCGFKTRRIILSKQVLVGNLEEFLSNSSWPQGDYSGLAMYSLAKEVSKGYRVVIGGDGGDEVFGGYPTYTYPYISREFNFISKDLIKILHRLSLVVGNRKKYLPLSFKLQQLYLAWGKKLPEAHFLLKNFLPQEMISDVMNDVILEQSDYKKSPVSIFENFYNNSFYGPIHRLCYIDFNTFLRSGTIPKVERNTMIFSLEARMPFLDNEIINLGLHSDSSLMVRGFKTKLSLKSLLKDKTKNKFIFSPIKHGFTPPLVALFEKELRSWKEYWLDFKTPFLKPGILDKLSKFKQKGWDLHRLEWNICVLNDWCFRNSLL